MGDNDRKRKHNRWNVKVKQKSVEAGVTGLFFSCEGHEKQALQEAYSIIDELLEDSSNGISTAAPSEQKQCEQDDVVDSDEDIADALKRACDDERQPKPGAGTGGPHKIRRCIQRPTGVKNCIFVSVKDADITLLAEKMTDLTQKTPRCRFLQRVYPVEHTLPVDLAKLNDVIMKVISENLRSVDGGKIPSYSIEFKARNNDSLSKNSILQMVDDAVSALAPTARVSLNRE
uniref:THUMP domain-containing protein n=1 Tax=Caenorhabditis japonica TaxID=281687 RepID=A0A8R1HML9_CAEJA